MAVIAAALCLLVGLSTCGCASTIRVSEQTSTSIAAAVARSQPGDVVAIPAGTYTVTEPIKPRSRTKLVGAGAGKTVLRFGGDQAHVIIDLAGVTDIEVVALTIDGARNPLAVQGILATRARRLKLHDIAIRDFVKGGDFGPHGIHFTGDESVPDSGVTDSVISDCTFERIGMDSRWGAAIRLSHGSSRNLILRNRIDGTGRGGILCDNGSTDVVIQLNVVTGSGGECLGIEVNGKCDRAVIEGNRVDHWISVAGCDLCAVRHNEIQSPSGAAEFSGIEAIGRNLVITDNMVGEGQQIGLSLSEQSDRCFYGFNTVRGATQWGAQLDGDVAHQYFYRCTFADTPVGKGKPMYPGDEGNGFRILNKATQLVFEECQFLDNARFGIQMIGSDVNAVSFDRCTIAGNKQRAVDGPDSYSILEWVGCRVEGNGDNSLPAVKPFAQPAPVASFEAPADGRVAERLAFANTSRAASGTVASVLWDFGDGPPVVEDQPTHIYQRAGTYRVTLVIWDSSGRAARTEREIRVAP